MPDEALLVIEQLHPPLVVGDLSSLFPEYLECPS
jgi:hypothetical protein